jgi:MFS family permease
VLIDLAPLRRSRDLRLLVLGELVSVFGTQLTTVAVPYQVYQLTHSSLDVGLVSLAQLFPLIGGALLGGSVVDAMDRRRLLMVAQVLMAGCSAGLAGFRQQRTPPVQQERIDGAGPSERAD